MKRYILSGIIAVCAAYGLNAALTKDFYKASSVLNSGKWVKIGVEKTGVYEISYETLKEMGFSDPSKVSLYGRGGRTLSESFVTNAGVPVITDDLTAVKVLHEDNKLYFYGLGPEEIGFNVSSNYDTGGYFARVGNNVYTRRGYYFLTDSRDISKMTEKNYDTSSAPKLEKGVGFVYHELDSVHNSTQSGQLFWGEYLGVKAYPGKENAVYPMRKWDINLPDAVKGSGVMECVSYFAPSSSDWNYGGAVIGTTPTVKYGFLGEENICSTPFKSNTSLYFAPHEPSMSAIGIPGDKGTVFVQFSDAPDIESYSNLDYWVVSYQSNVPTLTETSQQLIAFPSIERNTTGRLELSDPASLVVLDVTSESDPQRLRISQNGPVGTVGVRNTSKAPVVVVFDKTRPQLQISGYQTDYTQIANQNLHDYKEKGADLVIITTPMFRSYAEELADIHRKHDDIQVVVATAEELYNEFSGGTPDPMAYRSFVKMLYFSERKPKNVLLFGPLYGDVRGMLTEHNPSEILIAYQSPSVSVTRGAHNINDFYGMMSDKFRTDYYERNEVQVGVGILPVKFESDAKTIIEKTRAYIEREDFAYYLNRFMAVGGIGDDHTHDIQVRDLNNHIRALDNVGTIYTPLSIDTYGNAEARKKFLNKINDGGTMFSYFGHGAEQFLGKNKYFFNAGDVFSLRNQMTPFALFGGCQITNTDRGFRGLGETIVLSTPYGCIGSIVSGRDTWSGQNFEFFKQFFTCLYTQGSTTASARREFPVTIGEVYAAVKNYSTYSNELSYQLLCDPAIVIPTINRSVKITKTEENTLTPGNYFSLTAAILKGDSETVDTDFNGEVVVRLNEPEKQVAAGMIESKEDPKSLTYSYRDEQVSMMAGKVVNGEFSIDIHVPSSMANFSGADALLYIAAYDPSTKVGAGRGYKVTVGASESDSQEASDNINPVIENLSFDNSVCSIDFAVSDNLALNMSSNPLNKGLYLYVDGKERSEAHFVEPVIESGRAAFSKKVFIDGLSYGEHSARIKVKDAAGNSAEQEITFTYQPLKAKYTISKDIDNSSASSTVIKISDGLMPSKSYVVILSPEGMEVWRGELSDNSVVWNHEDYSGEKVPAGHYKAFLIESGDSTGKGHSESIDVPVI